MPKHERESAVGTGLARRDTRTNHNPKEIGMLKIVTSLVLCGLLAGVGCDGNRRQKEIKDAQSEADEAKKKAQEAIERAARATDADKGDAVRKAEELQAQAERKQKKADYLKKLNDQLEEID